MSETAEKRPKGQPSLYAEELVRDISVQLIIAHWNDNQTVFREQLRRNPKLSSPEKIRTMAARYDANVRAWLEAVDYVPRDHPDYKREVTFWHWCLRLEPPQPPAVLARNQEREMFLRKQNFFYNFDTNCKPWLEAIDRVRGDRQLKLKIPVPSTEDDDEWL